MAISGAVWVAAGAFTEADIVDWSYEDQSLGKLRGNHLQCAELRDLPKAEYEEQLDYLGLVCSD